MTRRLIVPAFAIAMMRRQTMTPNHRLGNTWAEVCLPVALLGTAQLQLDGKMVSAVRPTDRPGQVCLPNDLGGGTYKVFGA